MNGQGMPGMSQQWLLQLSPAAKRALLASLLKKAAAGGTVSAAAADARPGRGRGDLPVSAVQRRLWFFDQFEPGTWFYNIPVTVSFEGRLDVAALERSLAEIIRRHESLRTTVGSAADGPVQRVSPPGAFALPIVDLSALDASQWADEVKQRSSAETLTPFDLARGPLVRATLLRFSGERHTLFVTSHHIVCDGTSVRVLLGELSALYAAFSSGRPSPLQELPLQFADAVAAELEMLAAPELRDAAAYWVQTLAGAKPSLELPTDRPRPARQTFDGGRMYGLIPAPCAERLRGVARAQGATLFMALLAAYTTLLFRYTDQSDIVVGTPVAGRHAPGADKMIGCFVNMLPLRCDLSGDPPFTEMVARARDVALGAFRRQTLPFDKLVEELNPVRDASRAPVFQVVLNMSNYSNLWPIDAPDVRVSLLDVQHEPSMVDLTVYATEVDEGIRLRAVYNASVFERPTVEQFLRRFERLVDAASLAPDARLSSLPLLGADEASALAGAFSGDLDEA
jgi:hypothetical protein